MTDPGPPSPAGTVYGRGGVDVREPRGRLHPAVIALAAVAGVTMVLAGGYWLMRSPADPAVTPVFAGASASSTSSAPAPSTEPSESAPAELAAGSWALVLAGDPDTHLGVKGDFAAASTGEPATLTVSAGLADPSCFTFRNGDGKYLRHFDYRLRFDAEGDSDLFRRDATFCPVNESNSGTFRLRSKNYPDYLIHRRDSGRLYIDKPGRSGDFQANSTFRVRAAG